MYKKSYNMKDPFKYILYYIYFRFVHQLDKPTSGVLCLALNKPAARSATTEWENRRVDKFYLALVCGVVTRHYIASLLSYSVYFKI